MCHKSSSTRKSCFVGYETKYKKQMKSSRLSDSDAEHSKVGGILIKIITTSPKNDYTKIKAKNSMHRNNVTRKMFRCYV